jgi:indolepyruvate ferredoxin oxidoreductase beta subunit
MNILIAAVGGQGALLAARIIGNYALLQSLCVKVSEIHGMSQRGGSVVTHVRFGQEIHSPVIEKGQADMLLGLELLEAARSIAHLRPGGTLIVAKQQIQPLPVLTGASEYPPHLLDSLANLPITTCAVDTAPSARRLGNAKAVNTVLIGVLARRLSEDPTPWQAAVAGVVPAKHRELNKMAFDMGWNFDLSSSVKKEAMS